MNDPVDPTEFVTVGRFTDPSEAQMAKGALEAEGIEVFLQGENANILIPGAFRSGLQVHRSDEADARELLDAVATMKMEGDEEA